MLHFHFRNGLSSLLIKVSYFCHLISVTNATRDLETQYYNGNHISNFLLLANVRAGNLDAASEILREVSVHQNILCPIRGKKF